MFDQIARRYDILNRMMSFGIDIHWRNRAIKALQLKPHEKVLDLATGTADLALQMAMKHQGTHIFGLDPSRQMLKTAQRKVVSQQGKMAPQQGSVFLLKGDAQALPFPDAIFDAATMAFGIRNVPDRLLALQEVRRVLKKNGRAVILELSEPPPGLFRTLARFYMRNIIPFLGGLLSTSQEYQYLQKSIHHFPPPQEFSALIKQAGFQEVQIIPLTFGVCNLYWIKCFE